MKNRDYFRLARLSLKSKKKTTIQTIFGISFGLILLFPLLFVAIGFYGGFNAEINSDPYYRSMRVSYGGLDTVSGQVFCNEKYEKEIDSISGITKNLKYDYYFINNKFTHPAYFSLNGGEMVKMCRYNNRYYKGRYLGVQVIDQECAHDPFLDIDYYHTRKPLMAGRTFSKENSRGEIMVSDLFLSEFNLKPDEIIGSSFSLYKRVSNTRTNFSSSRDEIIQPAEYKENVVIPFFKDYTIIGVYDSDIYSNHSPRHYSLRFDLLTPYTSELTCKDFLWISTDSLGENGEVMAPQRISKQVRTDDEIVNESWYYYEEAPVTLSEKVTDAGYAFLPLGLGLLSRANHYQIYTKTQLLEFSSFQTAKHGYDNITSYYRQSVTGQPDNYDIYSYADNVAPPGFLVYHECYDRFLYLCISLAAFGGVIFIATMLNLINSLHFSIKSMRGFLGICKAVGLKKKEVVKLFFSQINFLFGWGYIFTVFLGGGACVAIKLLFDKALAEQITDDSTMVLTLQWWYIPIALGVLLVLTTLISFVISYFIVRKFNKTPVLEVLSEENKG